MKNVVRNKSLTFAVDLVRYCNKLSQEKREYIISKQLCKSGTAIGALIFEAEMAESRKDFIHKLSIALKEANETKYWLYILNKTYPKENIPDKLLERCLELLRLLVAIVKSCKK